MGQNGLGWINPRYVARTSGSPAALMLAAATELQRRWADGGWDDSVEEVLAVRQTLSLLSEVLGDDMMAAHIADVGHEAALPTDAYETVRKAAYSVASAARELQRGLGHLETDAGQLKALVKRGM